MEMFVRPRPKKSFLPPPPKKRKLISAVEEINFDLDARADYLTGFHKRKVQRAKQAQVEAAKKSKEERVVMRKQLREERKKELEEHVEAVNNILKEAGTIGFDVDEISEREGWNGFEDDALLEPINHEAEYMDEDRYTIVTVEAVDVTKEGLQKVTEVAEAEDEDTKDLNETQSLLESAAESSAKKLWPKKKKKKFRYESKAERKITRGKQKAGNKAKADDRRGHD